MKKTVMTAAYLAFGVLAAHAADPNPAPDWSVIVMTADIARPAGAAWEKIGGNDWCGIAKYLAINTCVVTSGTGEVGSVRLINGTLVETVVARTSRSYTYAQSASPIFYHGTMAIEPVDAAHSRLVYTLLYDQAPLTTPDAKAANREQRRVRFQLAVDKMKAAAEAP